MFDCLSILDKKIIGYFWMKTGIHYGSKLLPYLLSVVLEAAIALNNSEAEIRLSLGLVNNLRFTGDSCRLTKKTVKV